MLAIVGSSWREGRIARAQERSGDLKVELDRSTDGRPPELAPAEPPTASPCANSSTPTRHRADRRDADGQKALLTDDNRFAYMDGEGQ
jgi:hypothetical protein